jgi:hypothetical protein
MDSRNIQEISQFVQVIGRIVQVVNVMRPHTESAPIPGCNKGADHETHYRLLKSAGGHTGGRPGVRGRRQCNFDLARLVRWVWNRNPYRADFCLNNSVNHPARAIAI